MSGSGLHKYLGSRSPLPLDDPHGLDLNSKARSDLVTSEILFGVGGAAIAGAAVMWFVGAPHATRERVSVIPNVTASHAGLAVIGQF